MAPILTTGAGKYSAASAAFTPASLSPAHWGEANNSGNAINLNGSGGAPANGNSVGFYLDLSGNAYNFISQANDATRPTMVVSGTTKRLSFNASNSTMLVNASAALGSVAAGAASWFMAIRASAPVAATMLMGEGSSGATAFYSLLGVNSTTATDNTPFIRNDASSDILDRSNDVLAIIYDGRDHVIGVVDTGSVITGYIDGIPYYTTLSYSRSGTFANVNVSAIGALFRAGTGSIYSTFDLYGDVEVNRALNSTEIANLTTYLQGLYTVANASNGIVAARGQIPTTTASIAANTTSRRELFSPADSAITAVQTVDVGWYLTTGGPTSAGSRSIKRYIEYPANTFTQITWSAATSVTVGAGATVVSDLVSLAIPAGTKFWERTVNLTSTVATFPIIELTANATTLGLDDGNDATDKGNSGTIAASASTQFFGAAAVLGTTASAVRSFLLVGDSLVFGASAAGGNGDVTSTDSSGGSGIFARTLGVHGYPYVKYAIGGFTASGQVSNSVQLQNFINVINYTDAITDLSSNDLSAGSQTLAQLTYWTQNIGVQLSGTGKTVRQATFATKTTSTDSWATAGNQTLSASGTMSILTSVNTYFRTIPTHFNAVLDVADATMTARNSNIWVTTGVANATTADGVHSTSAESATAATALAPSL